MLIKTLVENISDYEKLSCEHGLSLYIETKNHKILFDTGLSGLFAENAIKMDVNLSAVDFAVISHGHYDHGGGLETFLRLNTRAKIYVNKNAFGDYYANRKNGDKEYIGLDKDLLLSNRFVFLDDHFVIDEEIELFSNVKGDKFNPSGNKDLLIKKDDYFVLDDFKHEQNLIISENGKKILIAGCAHRGIVNIVEQFKKIKGYMPNYVIGGFHLYNRSDDNNENPEVVAKIAEYLLETKAKYFTCHCTGIESYKRLKAVMDDQIEYLSTGNELML